jgi:hypothetical protein
MNARQPALILCKPEALASEMECRAFQMRKVLAEAPSRSGEATK